jgi:tryptophan synthase alpha chain
VTAATGGAARIRGAFSAAAAEDRVALIVYLVAGFPDRAAALDAAEAALAAGVDMLEIGVPFSDPLADGPVIADAGRAALRRGDGLSQALDLARDLRARGHHHPILVMTYLNPLLARGIGATLADLRDAGVDGLIVPDLPAGELPDVERRARSAGLALAFLVAPNSAPIRIEAAIAASDAFLYVVPLFGVTGARDETAAGAAELLARMRAAAAGRIPVAAGFGISRPEHVARLAPAADGLIVGSAVVKALGDGGAAAVGRLVASLVAAGRRRAEGAVRNLREPGIDVLR